LYRATSDVKDAEGHVLVTAYAVRRPDGQWALLAVNKDHEKAHAVKIVGEDGKALFSGPVTRITFGKEQYTWHPNRKNGYAEPDGPAARSTVKGTEYTLPAGSVTVLRGK